MYHVIVCGAGVFEWSRSRYIKAAPNPTPKRTVSETPIGRTVLPPLYTGNISEQLEQYHKKSTAVIILIVGRREDAR